MEYAASSGVIPLPLGTGPYDSAVLKKKNKALMAAVVY